MAHQFNNFQINTLHNLYFKNYSKLCVFVIYHQKSTYNQVRFLVLDCACGLVSSGADGTKVNEGSVCEDRYQKQSNLRWEGGLDPQVMVGGGNVVEDTNSIGLRSLTRQQVCDASVTVHTCVRAFACDEFVCLVLYCVLCERGASR